MDEGGEGQEVPLTLSASSAYLGGISEIGAVYKSTSGTYDANISALVYVDGVHVGDADILSRTPPGPGEEDHGQGFSYDLHARNLKGYDIEIIIINGSETASLSQSINVNASPITDDYEFLIGLWEGLFERKPQGAELSAYSAALRDGSMTRQQVISSLRTPGRIYPCPGHFNGRQNTFWKLAKTGQCIRKLTSKVMAAVRVILLSNKHLLECHFQFQMTMEVIWAFTMV